MGYFGLLPIITQAYKKYFSDFELTIAVVGDISKYTGACRLHLKDHNFVTYPEVNGVPSGNLAKIVRLFEAARHPGDICTVNDVDIIPLQRAYFLHRYMKRRPNELLTIGREWYDKTTARGKFPMCWVSAEGHIFSQLVNPKNLNWESWVKSLFDYPKTDGKEKINQPFTKFSDESLLLGMLRNCKVRVRHERKYPLDKKFSYVVSARKPMSIDHLQKGGYIEGHHLMCEDKNKGKLKAIGKYLGIDFKMDWYLNKW